MKKNKILISAFLIQLLFIGSVQAACDLKSFRFGISHKALMGKLKLDPEFIESESEGAPLQWVEAPGEYVCKTEKVFQHIPVHFLLLYDKLVEIKIRRTSDSPSLISWAESIYGVKQNKPSSFYDNRPDAQWLWENSNATIEYSIGANEYEIVESVVIQ
jgi:hypothetical protein